MRLLAHNDRFASVKYKYSCLSRIATFQLGIHRTKVLERQTFAGLSCVDIANYPRYTDKLEISRC